MLPFNLLLEHSLLYGMVLSVVMSIVILVSLFLRPQIWLSDAPAHVQAAVGPLSPEDQRIKRLVGVPTMVFVIGLLIHAVVRLDQLTTGDAGFLEVALSTFLIIQVFNLVDLLLIDWLLLVRIRPRFVVVPGTEHLRDYGGYRFHFEGFLKGIAGSLVASLLIAAVVQGLHLLW